MQTRNVLLLIVVVTLTLAINGCGIVMEQLLGAEYELSISAPDTAHTSSLPVKVNFTARLTEWFVPVPNATVQVGDHYFSTGDDGVANGHDHVNRYGRVRIMAEAPAFEYDVSLIRYATEWVVIAR